MFQSHLNPESIIALKKQYFLLAKPVQLAIDSTMFFTTLFLFLRFANIYFIWILSNFFVFLFFTSLSLQ